MDPEEAKRIIAQVCAAANGPLSTHVQIQAARKTLDLLTHDELVAVAAESNGHVESIETEA